MSPTTFQRRNFLKAVGVSLALPLLESLPGVAAAEKTTLPRRLVCIGNEFGMYPAAFWPENSGNDYEVTTLLKPLDALRSRFTLYSHLNHGLQGGHFAGHTFLTGVKASEARGMAEGAISLDQRAAEHVGSRTRFPSLTIGSESGLHGGCQMSWVPSSTEKISAPSRSSKTFFCRNDLNSRRPSRANRRATAQGGGPKSLIDRSSTRSWPSSNEEATVSVT